ncbi:hypothetical protein [Acidisarcina polymorpha]|uniref:hypothetical protein n=1 Tax=Acidisarcina polymorpha TaxID=2211140 RepID=UPI001237FE2D|nr:hypothetical protein [Acidisarcina polymorpha]
MRQDCAAVVRIWGKVSWSAAPVAGTAARLRAGSGCVFQGTGVREVGVAELRAREYWRCD